VQVALAGVLLIAAALLGAFAPLDNALRSQRFSLAQIEATGATVFVDIDTASLDSVGVWPWPRGIHARILDELMALGAGKVAFDVDFAVASDAQGDAEFERSLADAGGYALLAAFQQQQVGVEAPAVNMPLPRFARHADPVAVNVSLDADGIVRNYPLGMWLGGRWVPSIAAVFGDLSPTAQGQFGIDYSIDPASVPRISARDLIEGRVPLAAVSGRNVVIGASAVELRDFFVVPRHGILPGALLQIIATETLQQGRALVGIGLWPELAALLVLTGIGMWLRSGRPLWAVAITCVALATGAEVTAALLQVQGALLADTAALHTGLAAILLSALVDEVRRRGEQHAHAARERDAVRVVLDRVISDSFDGVVIVEDNGRIVSASRSATLLLGQPLIGDDSNAVLPDALAVVVRQCFARSESPAVRELSIETPSGPRRLEYAATRSEVEVDGSRRAVVSLTFRDITERRAAEDRLLYLSRHDPLTGALTRASLLDEAQGRLDAGQDLSLVMLDLRRFRTINDTLGHGQGDVLLRLVVSRLRNMGPDAVARLGGDSFALLAPAMDPAKLTGYCESIAEWLSFPYQLDDGHRAVIAASAGATTSRLSGNTAETLLSHADMALSEAKQTAGNGVRLFEPGMDDRLHASQRMDAALREALRLDRLTLVYQPQVDLGTGGLVGAEALSRWTDGSLGIISPAQFVAAAEETGIIVELGAWVIEKACREAASWPEHVRVAVNVSPVQFELSDVAATIETALQRSGLDPRRLDIEITEGVFVRNASQVTATLEMIRAMGVGIALDDFGTGYSSLGYLGRLPIDKIKIDQSFVRELPGDSESAAIIAAVLSLAHALGKTAVAEGIETPAQAELLRAAGCDQAQGFHFGRPMSATSLREMAGRLPAAVA
jgi:diguanylate cyclase (GGDEF)-like protein/PAS domain S-box-containing protein